MHAWPAFGQHSLEVLAHWPAAAHAHREVSFRTERPLGNTSVLTTAAPGEAEGAGSRLQERPKVRGPGSRRGRRCGVQAPLQERPKVRGPGSRSEGAGSRLQERLKMRGPWTLPTARLVQHGRMPMGEVIRGMPMGETRARRGGTGGRSRLQSQRRVRPHCAARCRPAARRRPPCPHS